MNPRSTSVLDRVRIATASAHQQLEDRMDAVNQLTDTSGRRMLLPRYYRMHASAEQAVQPWLACIPELDFSERCRSPLLIEDLRALQLPVPDTTELPTITIGSVCEALGTMYVMEGSSLGGRSIEKSLLARGCDLRGLSFLSPYDRKAGERWRNFLSVLEGEGASDPASVERGAVLGFEHAKNCLLDAGIVS